VTAELLIRELERASQASGAISRLRLLILNVAASGRLVRSEPTRRLNSAGQGLSWEVPVHWDVVPFADLTGIGGTFVDGDWVESKDQDPSGDVRLTQLADVGVGHFRDRSSRFMRREVADRLNCTYLNPGDILIARMPDPLGRACIFPGDPSSCVTVVDVAMLRTARTDVDGGFVVQVLNSSLFGALVASKASGTTRQRISRGNLGRLPFPLPPLAEQHRIVAKVDELMAMCDELEAAQTKREARRDRLRTTSLRNLVAPEEPKENARFFLRHSARMITRPAHVVGVRQAILDLAVRGRLVPQNPGDRLTAVPRPARSHRGSATEPLSGGLPSGWVPATLGTIADIRYGFAFPSETFGESPSDGMPLIKIGDIGVSRPTVFVRGPYDGQYLVKSGDLLLGLSGSIKCARWAGPTALLNQRIARLVPGCHDVHPQWLFLTVTACLAQWQRETSKLTVQNIKAAQLREGPAPLPPLSEQRRIVAKVDELMAVCDELGQSLATEQTERARLLEALLHDALEDALPARELELLGAR